MSPGHLKVRLHPVNSKFTRINSTRQVLTDGLNTLFDLLFPLLGPSGPECPIFGAAVTHAQLSGAGQTTGSARHALI